MPEPELRQHIVYTAIVGSRAYGLDRAGSDVDRRGVYLAPAELLWSLDGAPEQLVEPGTQDTWWELAKALRLALAANPTVLETLWSPLVELDGALAGELRSLRGRLLSRRVAETFGGYAEQQMERMGRHLRRTGEVRWRHAAHCLRLLRAGAHALRTGAVLVDVSDERDRLLAVRDGRVSWEEVRREAARRREDLQAALHRTGLPEQPDRGAADALLVRWRRRQACG